MNEKPIVAITMGDPFGNGPEITVKALAKPELYDTCRPLVVGDGFLHGICHPGGGTGFWLEGKTACDQRSIGGVVRTGYH